MMYKLKYTKHAIKQFFKLDRQNQILIQKWLMKNLEGCENPRIHGKSLTGDRSGQWRFRIGKFRIITEILDNELIILVIDVGHRREIYD